MPVFELFEPIDKIRETSNVGQYTVYTCAYSGVRLSLLPHSVRTFQGRSDTLLAFIGRTH